MPNAITSSSYWSPWSGCKRPLEDMCWQIKVHTWIKRFIWKDLLYTEQVSIWSNAKRLWPPATVKHYCQHSSYLFTVCDGGTYQWTCGHIKDCHTDARHKPKYVMQTLELPAMTAAASAAAWTVAPMTPNTSLPRLYHLSCDSSTDT